jgi:signal transduction histidine kinase
MAMGIIFLVRRNYRQSKRNVVRLVSLNKQISEHNMHMQKTLNALEQSQEENTRMLKVITHDLRNPITSIVAIADMLLSNGGFGDDINQLLDIMRRSGLTATRMAEEILRAHSTEMPMEKVELQELLSFTVNMMQFKAKEKKQNIILTTEPVSIKANNDKLWRVMNNLIGNAIKFSPPGTCIRVNLAKKDVSALISIKDEGLGIAPELKEKVFDAFTPYKRPGTMGEESFGLGLSISKYIIEAHGGRLWFESELGKGSTFYVELIADPVIEEVAELQK